MTFLGVPFERRAILISGWKSTWRWSGRKWAFHPCLFLRTCSNSQRKTHQIAQIHHFQPQKWQYTTTEVILSFNIVISRCKSTILGLFNISHTFLYISNIQTDTLFVWAPYGGTSCTKHFTVWHTLQNRCETSCKSCCRKYWIRFYFSCNLSRNDFGRCRVCYTVKCFVQLFYWLSMNTDEYIHGGVTIGHRSPTRLTTILPSQWYTTVGRHTTTPGTTCPLFTTSQGHPTRI